MWWSSVRSLVTVVVSGTFCYLAISGKLDAKDFMVITLLIMNFYFLDKKRPEDEKETKK